MFQGNWKCSSCGGAITELPFQPRSESGLTCKACFIKQKNGESNEAPPEFSGSSDDGREDIPTFDPNEMPGSGEPAPPPPEFESAAPASGEKPKFSGDWKCSICGAAITSLPFEPRNTDGLKCIDCFKKSKA